MVFPDSSLPPQMNGGFKSQEEFRNYVLERHQDGNWDIYMQTRPSALRVADYQGESVAKAFPLLFPYGHSGCAEDPAVEKIRQMHDISKTYLKRTRKHVLRKYLQHGKIIFHGPLFNLIVSNILMKETIFISARIHANCKTSNGSTFAEQYGHMTADALKNAVHAVRNRQSIQYSSNPENEFLHSIRATCQSLPHSNEAADDARLKYFSILMEFGMPSIFLTVTPDDGRNYRIILYARSDTTRPNLPYFDVSKATKEDIIASFKMQGQSRIEYPGICAEEYHRIITLIIKHIFQWDEKTKRSKGQGCFGELKAWTLATEEQGRKTLHGHFLLFVKNWPKLLRNVQLNDKSLTQSRVAHKTLTDFCNSITSAQLFHDFESKNGLLQEVSPFQHKCGEKDCRPKKRMRFEYEPVEDQDLRDMRHKKKHRKHDGVIATCSKCKKRFKVDDMVTSVLRYLLKDDDYEYPDNNKKLEYLVMQMQQERNWFGQDPRQIAIRQFIHNVKVNIHNHKHATRCFKNHVECFANLPERPINKGQLHFKDDPDDWFDFLGRRENRYMFRYYPKRYIQDVFTNVHSPVLTKCFAYNTNVTPAMNGPAVFYVTGYQAKKQQKEERDAYGNVSTVLCRAIQKREEEEESDIPPYEQGYRHLLSGIYTQTDSHVLAAPLAHYLALHESRFRFSHDTCRIPVIGIENYLLHENTKGTLRMRDGVPTWHHKALDYIFRPKECEDMSLLNFHKMVFSKPKHKLEGDEEHFDFTDNHAFCETHTIVYHPRPCVATFPWTFLCSTAKFKEPLTERVASTAVDFSDREEYCRRFLILFIPFRKLEDLKGNSETYQDAFRILEKSGGIPRKVISYANNIQDIHNSINVKLPQNMLSSSTCADDGTIDDEDEHQHRETVEANEQMMEMIANVLAQTDNGPETVATMPKIVSPILSRSKADDPKIKFSRNPIQLSKSETIVYEISDAISEGTKKKAKEPQNIFSAKISTLNKLIMRQLVDPENQHQTNKTDNATGSVHSIIRWCQNDRLDTNQQIAVEIMASTYVLTFFSDAEYDTIPSEREQDLRKLSRERGNTDEKLRMFITGPAGAGKCT